MAVRSDTDDPGTPVRRTTTPATCSAPYNNIYFGKNGGMMPCCYNRNEVFGKYPLVSIEEAWFGREAKQFRNQLLCGQLPGDCGFCRKELASGKTAGARVNSYDRYVPADSRSRFRLPSPDDPGYPRVFEFELQNTCDLECAMCFGLFSSAIRRRREMLPPFPDLYDLAFVEQVAGFFPNLTDMKFLGGEPMLIDLYHRLWDKAAALKPGLLIHVTTSAAFLPAAVRKILERLNVGFVVSLDSLNPINYEVIRRNARLRDTLENIQYLVGLSRRKGTFASLAVCPMTCNWREIPELVHFANHQGMSIVLNTVWGPDAYGLRFLDDNEMGRILDYYRSVQLPQDTNLQAANREVFEEFVGMCRSWRDAARDTGNCLTRGRLPKLLFEARLNLKPWDALAGEIVSILSDESVLTLAEHTGAEMIKEHERTTTSLLELAARSGHEAFGRSYLRLLQRVREAAHGTQGDFVRKVGGAAEELSSSPDPGTFVTTLAQIGVLMGIEMIENSDERMLISGLLNA